MMQPGDTLAFHAEGSPGGSCGWSGDAQSELQCQCSNAILGSELAGLPACQGGCLESEPGLGGGWQICFEDPDVEAAAARLEVTFDGDASDLMDPDNAVGRRDFEMAFKQDVAAALGISLGRVRVKELRGGSLIVTFLIAAGATKYIYTIQLASLLGIPSGHVHRLQA
jgi:hypothetical protein